MRKQITRIVIAATLVGLSFATGQTSAGQGASSQQETQNRSVKTLSAGHTEAKGASPSKAHPKIKLGRLQASPQIMNPAAATADTPVTGALQKQRQAADVEAAQIRLGIRSTGQKEIPAVQSQPMSATAGSRISTPGAATAHTNSRQPVGPGKPQDVSGNPAPLARTAPASSLVLACTADPTMRIATVSGELHGATFSTDPRYNFYTITGCSFGDPGPYAKVYIYYQNTFHQEFQIQQWNDNGITLNLDPNLTGVLDQHNLTLVVQRADGKQATKSGFNFYAARATLRLTSFPRDQFALWQLTLTDVSHLAPEYASPSAIGTPDGGQPGIPGYAAEVFWTCGNCFAKKGNFNNVYMQGNQDVWKLERLQPGFAVRSYGMAHRDLDCSGYSGMDREGSFGMKLVGNELHAQWQGQTCVNNGCGGFDQIDCFAYSGSNYLINIELMGPRGVDPWTGKPL
jgi:hypothetical protein